MKEVENRGELPHGPKRPELKLRRRGRPREWRDDLALGLFLHGWQRLSGGLRCAGTKEAGGVAAYRAGPSEPLLPL